MPAHDRPSRSGEDAPAEGVLVLDRPMPEPVPPGACPNCGADRLGDYCQRCGQHHLDGRITFRRLWRDFAQRFLKLERGLLGTVWGMTTRPGGVARDYVGGRRRRFLNPVSYLVIGSAVSVLLMPLYFSVDDMAETFDEGLMQAAVTMGAEGASGEAFEDMSPEKQAEIRAAAAEQMEELPQLMAEMMEVVAQLNALLSVVLALLLALGLKLLFGGRERTYTLAETMVFTLYTTGHYLLLAPLVLVVVAALWGAAGVSIGSFAVLAVLVVWGTAGFYGRTWGNAALSAVAVVLAFGVYTVLTGLLGAAVAIVR